MRVVRRCTFWPVSQCIFWPLSQCTFWSLSQCTFSPVSQCTFCVQHHTTDLRDLSRDQGCGGGAATPCVDGRRRQARCEPGSSPHHEVLHRRPPRALSFPPSPPSAHRPRPHRSSSPMTGYTPVRHASLPARPPAHRIVTEQYAYMCDLKRTIDATVNTSSPCSPDPRSRALRAHAGPLRPRDALGHRQDRLAPVPDRLLPTGESSRPLSLSRAPRISPAPSSSP